MSSQKEQGSDDNASQFDFPLHWASETRSEELLLEPLPLSRGASALEDDDQEGGEDNRKAAPLSRLASFSIAQEAEEEGDAAEHQQTHRRGEKRQSGSPWSGPDSSDPLFAHGKGRRKKKPNGAPKRPMSAYNCFFKKERARLMDENNQVELDGLSVEPSGKISFPDLGRYIGAKWKALSEDERQEYKDLADLDIDRYRREMAEFEKYRAAIGAAQDSEQRRSMGPDDLGSTTASPYFSGFIAADENGGMPVHHASFAPPAGMPGGYAQALPNAGYGPPPTMSMLPPGAEISIPHQDGSERRYIVNYCVFMVTPEEARQYLASFPAMAHVQGTPPSMYTSLPYYAPSQNAAYGSGYYPQQHYGALPPLPPGGPTPWPEGGPPSSYDYPNAYTYQHL